MGHVLSAVVEAAVVTVLLSLVVAVICDPPGGPGGMDAIKMKKESSSVWLACGTLEEAHSYQ